MILKKATCGLKIKALLIYNLYNEPYKQSQCCFLLCQQVSVDPLINLPLDNLKKNPINSQNKKNRQKLVITYQFESSKDCKQKKKTFKVDHFAYETVGQKLIEKSL